ncbi:acyl-CoA dehydrogenase family protein, partial [Salmonella enterica]|uniref:acyl-CoA dehydrogenase family protein n=1 Tax=Salmonella enterica TaxID=28901 RepID=UPI001F2F6A3E
MDFSLTEEQELLLASIRELITSNFPEEYFRTCDQTGTYPKEFMQALAENGISMLGVPEEFGGIPADYVTQMLALMEISKCGAPAFLITNGQCIHSMRRFGSAEQPVSYTHLHKKITTSTIAIDDITFDAFI